MRSRKGFESNLVTLSKGFEVIKRLQLLSRRYCIRLVCNLWGTLFLLATMILVSFFILILVLLLFSHSCDFLLCTSEVVYPIDMMKNL